MSVYLFLRLLRVISGAFGLISTGFDWQIADDMRSDLDYFRPRNRVATF